MNDRRLFFTRMSALIAGPRLLLSQQNQRAGVPVITPDIDDLPFTMDGGVKVFSLVAEPVRQTVIPGRTFDLWGFNGSAPGPTIQAAEGDRVRIVFDNHLPEPTGIHWHGLELPVAMDGVPGIGQKPVMPGERFVYEFPLHQHGTFFYHSHMAMQEMVGMLGGFIIHPKVAYAPRVDKDYLIALQEYAVLPNNTIPNSMSMEFNWLTFNGKSGPASTPLIVREGERVRVRFINLGMDHHPIHLHGFTFWETGREGARQQESAWTRGNTTLVGVAQARDIEFVADRAGDWMLHCHMPHHMMNQMVSTVGPMSRTGPDAPGGQIPLFPQDALMEGPMMAMDKEVEKPETYGLPPGWSGFSGGMMTLVRVMPPAQYDKIMQLKAQQKGSGAQ
ncbi:MAG: copper oxidase [Acidobacteriota bacterium]|nr:copper oxidase [Acidobacteriota bacterium]